MKHADEQTLALMALGEETSTSAMAHLDACLRCRRELEGMRVVVATMRTPSPDEHDLLTPPDDVWDSIADALHLPTQPESAAADSAAGAKVPRPRGLGRLGRFGLVLAACAALLGAAAGSTVTWWVTRSDTPAATATADGRRLTSLDANSAGYARLSDSKGRRTLDITVKGLPPTSGYFEVWLMDRTHTKLVSMGVLGPQGHAVLPVPDNINLGEYSVVDVSVQPYNGKPDHSGESIVRGAYAG